MNAHLLAVVPWQQCTHTRINIYCAAFGIGNKHWILWGETTALPIVTPIIKHLNHCSTLVEWLIVFACMCTSVSLKAGSNLPKKTHVITSLIGPSGDSENAPLFQKNLLHAGTAVGVCCSSLCYSTQIAAVQVSWSPALRALPASLQPSPSPLVQF